MRPQLAHTIRTQSDQLATLGEYAGASQMSIDEVVVEMSALLDGGLAAIEAAEGELFLLTCPRGRTGALAEPPANLWEQLRHGRSVAQAAREWRLLRALERAGWRVMVDPARWIPHLLGAPVAIDLGVVAAGRLAPLLEQESAAELARGDGPLAVVDRAGVDVVAVSCPQHKLDEYVTAARRFLLSLVVPTPMVVLVLEAPRFQPVIVHAGDRAVEAISLAELNPDQFRQS